MTIVALEWLTFGLDRLTDAARRRGITVQLLTRDPLVYRHALRGPGTDGLIVTDIDTFDVSQVRQHLASVDDLQGLVNTTDTWSLTALELWAEFGLPGQNPAGVRLARDKARLRDRLYDEGLSRGASHAFDPVEATAAELVTRISFPAVIKDRAGTGSQNVWLVRSQSELEEALTTARSARLRSGLTSEPYFVGPLYSVESLTWEGETRVLGVSSRITSPLPHFREEGVSFPVLFPPAKAADLRTWISRVLDAVSYTSGFAHTEFIMTDDGFEVVEINPRLGGGLIGETMCEALDINVYDAFLDLALGKRPALMDLPLDPVQGAAQVLLYAPRPGTFEEHGGTEFYSAHPGAPQLYPVRERGDRITTTTDQRGNTSIVLATGETAEIAMMNALSAAGKTQVRIAGDHA